MIDLAPGMEMVAVQRMAQRLFPSGVAVVATNPLGPLPAIMPEEEACLSPRSVDKRRCEFAAGRAAARAAMVELGLSPTPILMADDRSPIWPEGVVGGISHTRDCALAAVALQHDVRGLGVDVEADTPLKPQLVNEICSADEQNWINRQADPLRLAKLIFSAKEAAYKCQFPFSRQVFGFDGMETRFDLENRTFTAQLTRDIAPFSTGDGIDGRFAFGPGLILTSATLHHIG